MAFAAPRTVVASAARTASGNSGTLRLIDPGQTLSLVSDVTAVSGTSPSSTLSVEWSHDGTTFAPGDTADAFAAQTATGAKAKSFTVKAPYYRVVWTLTGTSPSFTFSVSEFVS